MVSKTVKVPTSVLAEVKTKIFGIIYQALRDLNHPSSSLSSFYSSAHILCCALKHLSILFFLKTFCLGTCCSLCLGFSFITSPFYYLIKVYSFFKTQFKCHVFSAAFLIVYHSSMCSRHSGPASIIALVTLHYNCGYVHICFSPSDRELFQRRLHYPCVWAESSTLFVIQ